MTPRARAGDAVTRRTRLAIAEEFRMAAQSTREGTDPAAVGHAMVTLLVHAGIAAADAICCARLRLYSVDENHREAVGLLDQADRGSGRHLQVLLGMKTRAGYSIDRIRADDVTRAERAADALLAVARQLD